MPRRFWRVFTAFAIVAQLAQAQPPAGFQNEPWIAAGLTLPTAMEFLPDGRMLIAEFTGRVVIAQPGATEIDPAPVLQLINVIDEDATAGGERGLVNLIADPAFASNGYIYLFYTAGSPQRDRVSRFTMTGNSASLASEVVIWQGVEDSNSTDHHGGGMLFGADGRLYISTGDNGDPASCQSLTSDHGKVLRLNGDGSVPADNPFHDEDGPNIDAIWAYGLRNPYRMSLDAPTGRIYLGDVGQNDTEEVNVVVPGANYGWPDCEGPCGLQGVTNPIFSYSHDHRDGSVTGGLVYRGTQFPAEYQGAYFYGDYAQNWVRFLRLDTEGNVEGSVDFDPEDGGLDSELVGDPVMFKVGPDGALYYVDFGWSPAENPASIRRLRYTSTNQPPQVQLAGAPLSGAPPLLVSFSSAGSFDPEGQELSFHWTFGDGGIATVPNPIHLYTQPGLYTVRVSASDGANTTQSDILTVSVGNIPVGAINGPIDGEFFRAGDAIEFSGSATDAEDGALPASAFSWRVLFHHDSHVHPTLGPLTGVNSGSFTIPDFGHDFSGDTWYEIILTVTDSDGLEDRTSVGVYPEKVNLWFDTVPSGLALTIDGLTMTTPFHKDALVGFHYMVSAPDQTAGAAAAQYEFLSWSDGAAQTHTLTVPSVPANYIATYQAVSNPLPTGLMLCYALNEGFGTTAFDNSGNNRSGVLVNGASWTSAGRHGGGVVLDGIDDYVEVSGAWGVTGDSTYACWFNLQSYQEFQALASVSGVEAAFEIVAEQDRISVLVSRQKLLTTVGQIALDTWTHLAVVRSGDNIEVYINGEADPATGVASGGQSIGSCPLLLGADADANCMGQLNGFLDGKLDEFRVYSRALSVEEIQADMNTGTPEPAVTISIAQIPGAGTVSLTVTGPPGLYTVYESSDLSRWEVMTTQANNGSGLVIPGIPTTGNAQRFYRVARNP